MVAKEFKPKEIKEAITFDDVLFFSLPYRVVAPLKNSLDFGICLKN